MELAKDPNKITEDVRIRMQDVGFRCAANLDDSVPNISTAKEPVDARPISDAMQSQLWLLGGVAESVSRGEAEAFCAAASVRNPGVELTQWRLPTSDEVQAVQDNFRGPGPFWTSDGAVVQDRAAEMEWTSVEKIPKSAAFHARCVHD